MKEIGTARPNAADTPFAMECTPSVLRQGNSAAALGQQWEGEGVRSAQAFPQGVSDQPGSQQSHTEPRNVLGGKRQELHACPQ